MDQQERRGDQPWRFSQDHDRQNEHVGEVERLARKEDDVFSHRMPGPAQIVVGRKEKALKVPYENIIKREQRVQEQHVDVLEPLQRLARFMGRKTKDAASRQRVVFAVDIDAGVVASLMEDTPHVRVDSANIKDIVQGFVYGRHRRDGVVVAVVSDVQQKECLGEAAQKVEGNKLP